MKKALLAIAVALLFAASGWAADVTLTWTQSVSTDVTDNKVYWGPSSGNYPNSVIITAAETYTVTGLPEDGQEVFFAVTALDAAGNESGFSNEVSTTLTDTTPPSPPGNLQISEEITVKTNSDGTVDLRIARYAPAQ